MADLLWDCNESEGSGWVDEQEACRDVVIKVDSFTSGWKSSRVVDCGQGSDRGVVGRLDEGKGFGKHVGGVARRGWLLKLRRKKVRLKCEFFGKGWELRSRM